jgi:multisubunit Na+/H+ antiporter MnhB subunit
MKHINHITSALLATGTAGVALLTLGGLVPADLGFSGLAVLGVVTIALFDYARPVKSLRPLAPVLRPALPATAPVTRRVSAIVEKAA